VEKAFYNAKLHESMQPFTGFRFDGDNAYECEYVHCSTPHALLDMFSRTELARLASLPRNHDNFHACCRAHYNACTRQSPTIARFVAAASPANWMQLIASALFIASRRFPKLFKNVSV